MPAFPRLPALSLCTCLWLVACQRPSTPAPAGLAPTKPAQAVQLLTRHLRDNDFAAFARDAVPPPLHAQLEQAWREGRTRWPLDELPLDDRLPSLLKSLAAPGAEARLQAVFDRQFAGANTQIRGAAASLGLFGVQYLRDQGDYSDDERQHYTQLLAAASRWAMTAPLSDRPRAHLAIPRLVAAARRTGLASEADFRTAGMERSLQRLGPFAAAFKQVLAGYGLALDDSLAHMQASLLQQTGDRSRVRMRYRLAGRDIDTVVGLERIDGRWYLEDYLRHARAAVADPAPTEARTPAR